MVKPDNPIESATGAWLESQSAYTTLLQQIDLLLPESRQDTLILRVQNQGENPRHFRVSRPQFLAWMKDKVEQLESLS